MSRSAVAPGGLSRFCWGCAALGIAVLIACALITVVDVIGRRTLGLSLPGLIDLSQLPVMTGVFLCLPYAFERRAKFEVDLVFGRLPRPVRRALALLWSMACAGFLALIVWHAGRAAGQVLEYGERSPTLALPMIFYWLPILFGCELAGRVCLQQMISDDEAHR